MSALRADTALVPTGMPPARDTPEESALASSLNARNASTVAVAAVIVVMHETPDAKGPNARRRQA
ncbi:MAG: hypothetical protein AB1631_05630 [Acidobacteriota bacterium]